ncbi:hypothetical protein HANVADRAFT_62972 [Hanseniaspora valbyensis NRRL Y-1626]|uniref:PIN domain-containing protein n=1 Tax=Hanseniaspora valbyensis NRRL Y-1626 TaxID=766949 RepID=A0A1B7TC16_9ASCO|nr:hypothetical protein HANVADRAFT_62972 [Hanseniaspora valbyensis NRRL Y-1626]
MDYDISDGEDINDIIFNKLKAQKKTNTNINNEKNKHNNAKTQMNTFSSYDSNTELFIKPKNHENLDEQNRKVTLQDVLPSSNKFPFSDENIDTKNNKTKNKSLTLSDLGIDEERIEKQMLKNNKYFEKNEVNDPKSRDNLEHDNMRESSSNCLLTGKSFVRSQNLFELVLDTNFIIDNLPLISTLVTLQSKFLLRNRSFFKICIFDIVLSELDKLKQNDKRIHNGNAKEINQLKFKAIKANDFIYKHSMETVNTNKPSGSQILHMVTKRELIANERKLKSNKKYYNYLDDEDELILTNNNDDRILKSTVKLQNIIEKENESAFDYIFFSNSDEDNGEKFKLFPSPLVIVLSNDKNFCLKLLSHSIKTISLPPNTTNCIDETLRNAKTLTLKCLNVQLKTLLQDWQDMIKLNVFETLIKDQNCNTTMRSIFNEVLNYSINEKDFSYLTEMSLLFSVNNLEMENLGDLLDKAPNMLLLFQTLLNYSTIFQQVLLETLKILHINVFNPDYCNELLKTTFFHNTDSEIESFLDEIISFVLIENEEKGYDGKNNFIIKLDNYIATLNDVSKIWEVILFVMSHGIDQSYQIQNFKIKLDFIWKDIVSILEDVVTLANINIKDLDS